MVDVVTQQQATEQHVTEVQAGEAQAAEEMAQAAQEAAVQDTTAEVDIPSSEAKEWEDLLTDEDSDDAVPEVKPVETPPTEETPPEEPPAEETPPAEEVPPVEAPPAEETPTPEVVVPPVEETPAETRTPEEVTAEVKKARETAHEKLVESFKWTEEQTEQFEDDPGKVMSEMAANLFLDLYDSISQGLNSQMPGMVQGIMRHQDAVRANEQKFFGAWPQLADPKYRETVDRISNAYRQQNPTTDEATAVKEIGAQAWVALRLPLDELMAHTQDAPAAQVVPVIPTPGHVPASAGNAPQSAHTPAAAAGNEYEQLATELLNDDRD